MLHVPPYWWRRLRVAGLVAFILLVVPLPTPQAEQMLRNCHMGTFLFRFSESDPAVLVLGLVKGSGAPIQVLVNVLATEFELMTGRSSSITFKTLGELVMRYLDLHFLYPAIPKQDVFG